MEYCNSGNRHAANQVSSAYIFKETTNQSVVAALFNRMQPYKKASLRKRSTSITSGSGTSGSKTWILSKEGNIQGDGLGVGNDCLSKICLTGLWPPYIGEFRQSLF